MTQLTGKLTVSDKYRNESGDYSQYGAFNPGFSEKFEGAYLKSIYNNTYDIKNYEPEGGSENTPNPGKGVPSLANRFALYKYSGFSAKGEGTGFYKDQGGESAINNNIVTNRPTASNIITYFRELGTPGMQYDWSDFLHCTYNEAIPNNYMLTLRRFHMPTADNIYDPITYDYKNGKELNTSQPDIARAITWFSESTENNLTDILSWNNGFNWKDVESEVQKLQSNDQGVGGSKGFFSGPSALSSFARLASGTNAAEARLKETNSGFDPLEQVYPNYTEGPYNVIKQMVVRDAGLVFNQEFDLNFHFDLRAHYDINPKMAFLDVLSNLLVLTYNNAPFWGGATRYIDNGAYGKPLGDHDKLVQGDTKGFLDSVFSDLGDMGSNVFGDGSGGFSLDSIKEGLGNVGQDVLGGFLSEQLNTPQGAQLAQAFLTGEPTGQWHLTIGNPANPMMMVGNLTLQDAQFQFEGPLGYDDFPSRLKVTIKLKPGRPRDKGEIETAFNAGRGRLYHTPKGFSDVLNNEGKQPTKITGYGTNPDEAIQSLRKRAFLNSQGQDARGEGNNSDFGNQFQSRFTSLDRKRQSLLDSAYKAVNEG